MRPPRILLLPAVLCALAVISSALGIVGTGSAQSVRAGVAVPGATWKVVRISGDEVSTGHRTGGLPFAWGTGLSSPRRSEDADRSTFCVFVTSDGPLLKVPAGGLAGEGREAGGTTCGPIDLKTGLVKTTPIRGGSITQPEGESESWQAFDLGVVSYPPSVDKVRLRFAGGGSTVLPLKRMPAALRPPSWESFRYASFAVYGCVDEVEGLARNRVVARMHQSGCGA